MLSGARTEQLLAECRAPADDTWRVATVYVGDGPDDWRTANHGVRNEQIVQGRVPAGSEPCVWNCWFDLEMPVEGAEFRLRSVATGDVVFEEVVDLTRLGEVLVADCRNFETLAEKPIAAPWGFEASSLRQPPTPTASSETAVPHGSAEQKSPHGVEIASHSFARTRNDGASVPARSELARTTRQSRLLTRYNLTLHFTREVAKADDRYPIYRYVEAHAEPIVLSPGLTGGHRIYVGTEEQTSFQLSLSKEDIKYPVPEYFAGERYSRQLQDYLVTCADMTGQGVRIEPGGARYWRDVSIRYIRFVPMTEEEVRVRQEMLDFAREHGRPFAAYVEPVTPCHYQPRTLKLRDHVRNQMRLHEKRGCTDAYVHVVRLGSQAWYHSDEVERYMPEARHSPDHPASKWCAWMEQGDPLGVAVEEARAVGLKVLPDMGMNVSYEDQRDKLIRVHPEYLVGGKGIFLDYRRPGVRDYAVRVATELLTKYDVDGIHLDYARFAANTAYDTHALIDVGRRIHEVRLRAEAKWGHPLAIAARIPSYRYHQRKSSAYTGEYAEFLEALKVWAREGWIERGMVCSMGRIDHLRTISVERYAEAVKGTNCVLWGDLYGGGAFPNTAASEWLDVARAWAQQGLDGGFFFYAIDRPMEFFDLDWQLRLTDFPKRAGALGHR
jgi:hypothetical protein